MELRQELCAPVLTWHPFFKQYAIVDEPAMRKLCYSAVSRVTLSHGDSLFDEGEACKGLSVAMKGALTYIHRPTQDDETSIAVVEGRWISEAGMWVTWQHRGLLRAAK